MPTFPVSKSITPDPLTERVIGGVKLRSPQPQPGLGGGPAAAPGLNAGLGPAPVAPAPTLATAQGVQGMAQQQGLPLGLPLGQPTASPTPAPLPKLGGENWQVAKSALGARPAAQKREPLRSDALFGMLRGGKRRPVKRSESLTPAQQVALVGGLTGTGALVGTGIGGLRHLFKSKREREQQGLLSTVGENAWLGAVVGLGSGISKTVVRPWMRQQFPNIGKRAALLTLDEVRSYAPQAGLTPPYLQQMLGMNDPERQRMNQLLGVESQLAAGQGAAENPSQDPIEELELQKTVLSREVPMPTGRDLPIKDWYTFGKKAMPGRDEYAQKKKPGSNGASFRRLKEAGLSNIGAGFLAEALSAAWMRPRSAARLRSWPTWTWPSRSS